MTQEILVLNPSGKKMKGKNKMSTKRKRTKKHTKHVSFAPTAKKTRRRRRHNPSGGGSRRVKRYASRAGGFAKGIFASLNIKETMKMALAGTVGALLTQFAAKKWGTTGGANENWGVKAYGMGALGGIVGAILADSVKKGSGKYVLQGAFTLLAYKAFVNEVASKNETLGKYFGENDEQMLLGQDEPEYLAGDVYTDSLGENYVLGTDGNWRPIDESHRLMGDDELGEEYLLGESLVTPGRLGEALVEPGRLGDDQLTALYGR